MEQTEAALNADSDAAMIIAVLQNSPPGRVYAGLRDNYGDQIKTIWLRFPDLLTFHQIETVAAPYQSLSINSDVVWHFDYTNQAHYDVFNARYVVAATGQSMPDFLTPILASQRYTLYAAPTSGYIGIGSTTAGFEGPQEQLHVAIRAARASTRRWRCRARRTLPTSTTRQWTRRRTSTARSAATPTQGTAG
jgi:hypothetical protein